MECKDRKGRMEMKMMDETARDKGWMKRMQEVKTGIEKQLWV